MADEKSKRTSRPETDTEKLVDWIWGEGTTNRIDQSVNDWGRETIQSAREAIAAAAADAEESDQVIVTPVEVAASGGGSGESEPESNVDGEGEAEEGRWTPIPPEVVKIPGGQIRIYRDSDGKLLRAERDEIDARDGETTVNWIVERYTDEAALWAARAHYAGLPPTPDSSGTAAEGGDRAADEEQAPLGRSRTTWERVDDYLEDGTPMTKPIDMNTKNVRPGVDDMVGAINEEAEIYGADPFKGESVTDAFGRGQLQQLELEATGAGNKPPSNDPGHTPGSSSNPPPDPMDPNQTSAINRNDLDVFNRFAGTSGGGSNSGSASGSGSGSSGSGETGLGGTGLGAGGFDFGAIRPGTTGAVTGGNDSGGGTGTGTGAAGNASGGSNSGDDDSGSGTGSGSGSSGGESYDLDGDGQADYEEDEDGNVVTDEWTGENESDESDETGVSTSVDPMGGNTRASAADIQRAAEWAAWQRGNRTPIDPADDGGYAESRGGTFKVRDAATELGQPPDDAAPRADVPDSIAPRGQGEVIMPTDDTVSDPQMGPEDGSMNPFGPPPLGSGFGSNGSSSSAGEEKESMPVQETYVAEVNIIEQPKDPLPPGTMYAIHDTSSHQYQQSQLEQEQAAAEDTATNKMVWQQEEHTYKDLTPIRGGGDMPSRYESDDEDDAGSLG